MARLSRKLRVCKWIGTVGCVLIVGAFLASGWLEFGVTWKGEQFGHLLSLDSGAIWIQRGRAAGFRDVSSSYLRSHDLSLSRGESAFVPDLIRPIRPVIGPISHILILPLWVPFVFLLIPTMLLWRRDRQRPRPGFCQRCDYDLTGNVSGRCPECGLEIAEPTKLGDTGK
jgi:hypothetical protein